MSSRPLLPALALTLVLATLSAAAAGCVGVAGTFTNTAVPPPACTSPVLFCTHGDLDGDLDGDYDFVMSTQTPDLQGPPVTMDFTGASTITLPGGQMFANDQGTITFRVGAMSPFETHVNIHSGSGAYAGAHGHLVARGEYDLVAGAGHGTYEGTVCR